MPRKKQKKSWRATRYNNGPTKESVTVPGEAGTEELTKKEKQNNLKDSEEKTSSGNNEATSCCPKADKELATEAATPIVTKVCSENFVHQEDELYVPCLDGEPVELGMTYDTRLEMVIRGHNVWKTDLVDRNSFIQKLDAQLVSVLSNETFSEKTECFSIPRTMTLSIISRLASFKSALKYLNNFKASEKQARVALIYKLITIVKRMHIGNICQINGSKFEEAFQSGPIGTHCISGIVYGVNAVFVFDRDLTEAEDCNEVEEKMKKLVIKIPATHNEYGNTLPTGLTEEDYQESQKLSCTYFGDLDLGYPSTYEEVLDAYRTVPRASLKTANNNFYGVQKGMYVYPLYKINEAVPKVENHIDGGINSQLVQLFEELSAIELKAADVLGIHTWKLFSGIKVQIETFKQLLTGFLQRFQEKLGSLVPKIQLGEQKVALLYDMVDDIQKSPFNPTKLIAWLEGKMKEANLLDSSIQLLTEYPIISKLNELEQFTNDKSNKHVVAFCFGKLFQNMHPFVEEMSDCVKDTCKLDSESSHDHWFENESTVNSVSKQVDLFLQFAAGNRLNDATKFVVLTAVDPKASSGCYTEMVLFTEGCRKIFQPPSPPGKPKATLCAEYEIELKWDAPENGAKSINYYSVTYKQVVEDDWHYTQTKTAVCNVRLGQLEPSSEYICKISAICNYGRSEWSEISDHIGTKTLPSLAFRIINECKPIMGGEQGHLTWYQLPLLETYCNTPKRLNAYSVGVEHYSRKQRKVILLVGATGSGKTTLVNGMMNYLFGVNMEDEYRLQLISEQTNKTQAHSQTQCITAYTVYWQPGFSVDYTLTIIDTPGYGDTRGIVYDERITKQIREFFEMEGPEAIDELHAVGFVAQSSVARLTDTQKYVFDSILSIFGKDVSKNIFLLLTFADGRYPPAMEGIDAHNMPYNTYYKFNNSVFTRTKLESTTPSTMPRSANIGFDGLFWKLASDSFTEFFENFRHAEACSLRLTKQVLNERHSLEVCIENLQKRVKSGLNHLTMVKQELAMVEQYEAEKCANQTFTREVSVPKTRRVHFTERNRFVTNCLVCSSTCHEHCGIPEDKDKHGCWAMDGGGEEAKCRICTERCHWTQHCNRPYYFEDYVEVETVTLEDLKAKYDQAYKNLSEKDNIIAGIAVEYNKIQKDVLTDVEKIRELLEQLDKIALKPNPLTTVQYIDILIRATKNEAKFGWEERLEQLQNARERAVIIQKMKADGIDYDPFEALRTEIEVSTETMGDWLLDTAKKFLGFFKKKRKPKPNKNWRN